MDLNADLGEGAGSDTELLGVVTSASIACGGHAGSSELMADTVLRAREAGVAIGAHPGYPDRAGFGRVELGASPVEIEGWVREQVEALLDTCRAREAVARYVKVHGAMYNRAVRDAEAAAAIVAAVVEVDPSLFLLALPGSAMLREARVAGLRTAREAFLDRGYQSNGALAPRGTPGALISDADAAAERALALSQGEPIRTVDGQSLRVTADSLCVHGDSPAALQIARTVRARLQQAGVVLRAFA